MPSNAKAERCCRYSKNSKWYWRWILRWLIGGEGGGYQKWFLELPRAKARQLKILIWLFQKFIFIFSASPEREAPAGSSSRQPMSYVDQASTTGPSGISRPPPLPPKSKSQSQSDDSMDPIMSSSDNANAHVDWFSNPLFDSDLARRSAAASSNHNR